VSHVIPPYEMGYGLMAGTLDGAAALDTVVTSG